MGRLNIVSAATAKPRKTSTQGRIDNINELLNGIKDFSTTKQEEGITPSLVTFLEEVSLLTDQDNEGEDDINKITLMTIHSAKGLEFKNVYIVEGGIKDWAEKGYPLGNKHLGEIKVIKYHKKLKEDYLYREDM